MSRKKIKKETVKRKTNIYDPMGVYGRGLTENQRQGMTRRMKIENIRNPEKNITKEDLEEYKKILEFYGITRPIQTGSITTVPCSWPFQEAGATITNSHVYLYLLNNFGITPIFFVCDSFVITRPSDVSWNQTLWYTIRVGESRFSVVTNHMQTQITTGDSSVTVPRYFMNGTTINYFRLCVDDDASDMYIQQAKRDLGGTGYDDFRLLPNNGTPIPYLLYPNNALPELLLDLGADSSLGTFYQITMMVTVMS